MAKVKGQGTADKPWQHNPRNNRMRALGNQR